MNSNEDYSVTLEYGSSDEKQTIELGGLPCLPREGEILECNYVHGKKITVRVTSVRHFLYNSGDNIVQNVVIAGNEV